LSLKKDVRKLEEGQPLRFIRQNAADGKPASLRRLAADFVRDDNADVKPSFEGNDLTNPKKKGRV